jgi:hypothetical protein
MEKLKQQIGNAVLDKPFGRKQVSLRTVACMAFLRGVFFVFDLAVGGGAGSKRDFS